MAKRLSQRAEVALGDVFRDHVPRTKALFERYKTIYELQPVEKTYNVDRAFFDYCRKRNLFTIIALYSLRDGVFLIRTVGGEDFGWELPGSSIRPADETVHDAVFRIIEKEIPRVKISELEPVAIVKNKFECEGEQVEHIGIAFSARSRNVDNKILEDRPEVAGLFVANPAERIFRFANREVYNLVMGRLQTQRHKPPDEEIDSSARCVGRYQVHKKTLGSWLKPFSTNLVEKKIFDMCGEISGKTFLDVSCGDSELLFAFARNGASICVGNDISWIQVRSLLEIVKKKRVENVLFTNHNITALPFQRAFDYVLCKNTLHHMQTIREFEALLENLAKVCREKLIVIEIEDPMRDGISAKLLHKYYEWFLCDVGKSFFTKDQFQAVLSDYFGNRVHFDQLDTVKGRYLFAIASV